VFDEKRIELRRQYSHLPGPKLAEVMESKSTYGDTFFARPCARWNEKWIDEDGHERPALKDVQTDIGETLDKAIAALEDENEMLHGTR
jgi:type I restriction enzyme M protein